MEARDYNAVIEKGIREAIKNWFTLQSADISSRYYLYYQAGNLILKIAEQAPSDSWTLAAPQAISGFQTTEQVFNFCYQVSRRLPILPAE